MKDLDSVNIEQIIRLPFFYSLKKANEPTGVAGTSGFWEITFRCNKTTATGWQLLDELSDNEYIVRYKIIDFK